MLRARFLVSTTTVVLIGLVAAACSDSPTPPGAGASEPSGSTLVVRNVLPPGEALAAPGTASQRDMYDGLNTVPPGQITDATAQKYYKDASLDPAPGSVVREERPRHGVTIKWDRYGVPFVYGSTDDDTAYGAGWAGTQSRMFAMDAVRYLGAGRLSELLGPAGVSQDVAQLRAAAYTRQDAQAQLDALAGPEGAELRSRLDAFVNGVNAARRMLCPTVTAPRCPKEYALLQVTPQPYAATDIVFAASVIGGIFGKGGGHEAANAAWLLKLQKAFGADTGRKIFDDTMNPLDPEAAVTVSGQFPYGQTGPVDPAAVALPDLDGRTAIGTGGPILPPTTYTEAIPTANGAQRVPLASVAGSANPIGMSNAVLVAGSHTTTGHPIAVFGAQTGYQVPNLLMEEALHGPSYNARGAAFVNLQMFVLLGRGDGYAWSATSASGDIIDTVAERLCNPDGSPATIASTSYLDQDNNCVPIETWQHVERGPSGAAITKVPVMRTRHGIVQYRTTVQGTPVAIVLERTTYEHEIDSTLGFARVNNPEVIHGQQDFRETFARVLFTFNWFYLDGSDIATFTSGRMPKRAAGVDMELPRWGDPRWDWKGYLTFDDHPSDVNPESGFLASWNNKPAIGEHSADNVYGWARIQRVIALTDGTRTAIADDRKLSSSGLLGVVMNAATLDIRGAYLLPTLLDVIGNDHGTQRYTTMLRRWAGSGAHRVARGRPGTYADQAAIVLFETWWALADTTVMRGRLGDLVLQLPEDPSDDSPSHNSNQGSAFNNVGWYGYLDKDLRTLLGRPVEGKFNESYCGAGSLRACRDALKASLLTAVKLLSAAQHQSDPAKWVYDTKLDEIQFTPIGLGAAAPMAWQNRPTFHQVVTTGPAPPPAKPTSTVSPAAGAARRSAAPSNAPRRGPGSRTGAPRASRA